MFIHVHPFSIANSPGPPFSPPGPPFPVGASRWRSAPVRESTVTPWISMGRKRISPEGFCARSHPRGNAMISWWNDGEMMVKWWWNDGEMMVNWWWNDGEMMVKWWWNDGERDMIRYDHRIFGISCDTLFYGGAPSEMLVKRNVMGGALHGIWSYGFHQPAPGDGITGFSWIYLQMVQLVRPPR